jgi:RNA recognition motif.
MVTLNVRGLPRSMTEKTLAGLFAQHGRVHKLKLAIDPFKSPMHDQDLGVPLSWLRMPTSNVVLLCRAC